MRPTSVATIVLTILSLFGLELTNGNDCKGM